tara:strand:- start:3333 stop:3920 length:588 start_codon:yes stop_codon:yes gene_type:complete
MNIDAIPGLNPRDDLTGQFDLVNINTPDGDFGFVIGIDGIFTDVNGKVWHGSSVIAATDMASIIGGEAPSGTITLSYFQDPSLPDLQAQILALGNGYLDGRSIQFYWQPFTTASDMYAPTIAPILEHTRTMRGVTLDKSGPQGRSITVPFEAWTEGRNMTRRVPFSVAGHEFLLGATNPSLTYRPTDNEPDEKLF